jgi:hypothetical protein
MFSTPHQVELGFFDLAVKRIGAARPIAAYDSHCSKQNAKTADRPIENEDEREAPNRQP